MRSRQSVELNRILDTAEQDVHVARGCPSDASWPEAFAQHLAAELQRWNEVVKANGIRPE